MSVEGLIDNVYTYLGTLKSDREKAEHVLSYERDLIEVSGKAEELGRLAQALDSSSIPKVVDMGAQVEELVKSAVESDAVVRKLEDTVTELVARSAAISNGKQKAQPRLDLEERERERDSQTI
ncbi:hypothetical protein AYI69_g4722 [Smittium culicis]|uniref:Uncharacterized protein n=1 Tax=Smittium culicis TaxID=133412 RepID=A0A1R1YBC9_9FUNG|nr:hypothetical protein AYI69_g4722 [Smittium culicis]